MGEIEWWTPIAFRIEVKKYAPCFYELEKVVRFGNPLGQAREGPVVFLRAKINT